MIKAYQALLDKVISVRDREEAYLCLLADDLYDDGIISDEQFNTIRCEIKEHLKDNAGNKGSTMWHCMSEDYRALDYYVSIKHANRYRTRFIKGRIKYYETLDN